MDTEDMVRGALRGEADGLTVGAWSAAAVQVHVRRQRRGRRLALGVSAVAAALVVGGTGVVLSAGDGARGVAPAAHPLPAPSGPAPEAVVVEPGQQVPLGREDWWMQLKDKEICIHDPVAYKNSQECGGFSWAGSATEITMQYLGTGPDYQEGLYNLVYRGPGRVASMAVELEGQGHWATVASLPGDPGFASGIYWGPALKDSSGPGGYPLGGVRLAAYDAEGRVLASTTLSS
ncbi:hypothetical protein SAMN05216371_7838 [Streptomyces sp. TLI_053]|uniref:hypothetical protein n=1 Tax=Streptomyces sp. TLI_053 TaxID=1855352 RepID=UPI00087D0B83|nr:hypothetical protein [Streptomyces sp. TLI_053]SDT83026.1 hypothetical protein SAMN05216371_7838 [Streptomyces sp. TLI_053]